MISKSTLLYYKVSTEIVCVWKLLKEDLDVRKGVKIVSITKMQNISLFIWKSMTSELVIRISLKYIKKILGQIQGFLKYLVIRKHCNYNY